MFLLQWFQRKPPTMPSPVDPKLDSNTHTYLLIVLDAMRGAPFTKYKVVRIEHKKQKREVTPTEHEYLRVSVLDTTTKEESTIFVERVMSNIRVEGTFFERLKGFPSGEILVNKITSILTSSSSSTPTPFYDKASLALVSSAHTSAEISSDRFEARDQVLGRLDRDGDDVRVIIPEDLYLPQLAFIIDEVHNHNPLYSLFEYQCYWFARLIGDAVVARFPSKDTFMTPPREDDTFHFPDERPNSSGRWRGFLVHNVKATVLPHVLQMYDKRWLGYQNQVIFSS